MARVEDARRRREPDVRRAPHHVGEVDGGLQQRPPGPRHTQRGHGDGDPRGAAVVVHPHVDGLPADEAQVPELPAGVVVVPGVRGGARHQAVDVDADVVAVGVAELGVEERVQLHGEDVGAPVAVVGVAEEAQELARQRGGQHRPVRGDEEGQAVGAQVGVLPEDGEHEGGGEGPRGGGVRGARVPERQRGRVESVAFHLDAAVGQHQEAVRRHRGPAVEGEVRALEAVVDELAGGGVCPAAIRREEKQQTGQVQSLKRHCSCTSCSIPEL